MPEYKVTLPDGRSFKVTAPEGTSMDQIRAKIKAQFGGTGATPEASVEDESEGTLQEIGEGIVGGVIEAGSGLLETAALVPDLATGSDYAVRVSEAKNKLKDDLGIDPTGAAGEITEALVQFVVPGLGAAGLIGKAAKLRNFSKASKTASQVVGAGVTDAIVASDGTTTIGDFFEGGPTMSSENVGETGREEAARRIGNKFKIGLEAAGATAAAGPVFKALGIAGQGAVKGTRAVSDVTGFSTLAGRTGETISASTQKIIDKYPVADQLLGLFRSRGMLPQQAFEEKAGLVGKVESQLNKTGIIVANLQSKLDKIFGTNNTSFRNIMIDGDSNTQVEAMNLLYGFLTKDKGFVEAAAAEARRLGQNFDANSATDLAKFLPDFMKSDAIKMRSQIDLLSRSISRSDFVQGGMIPDVENIITNNLQNYMRRKFAAFEDPNWFRSDNEAFTTAYENAVKFYRESPEIAEDLYTKLVGPIPENFTVGVGVNRRMTDASAREMMDAFVKRYEKPSKPVAQDGTVTRSVKDRLRTSLLTKEKLNEPALRAVLGEVKDPMEAFVSTVNDLAEFRAVDSYYQYLAKNFLDQGDEFISEGAHGRLSITKQNEYRKLDSGGGDQDLAFGALQGSYVKKPIYNNLTNLTRPQGTARDTAVRLTYGNLLRGKGLVQFAKTVLSPITQVRNVTTASLFAAAQGNIGRGANLGESIALVVDNIYKGEIPRLAKAMGISNDQARGVYFRKLQELGVVGTQAQVREIDRLLEEGFGGSLKAELDELGVSVGRDKGYIRRTLGRSKLGQFFDSAVIKPGQRITKGARDAYQGGDDIWKIYNFEFERNKLISALGSETDALKYATEMGFRSVDEYAADIVKNVVPNYERVPEAIKLLRRAPFGNFIAFPAEIMRTSANTLSYAIKELQSANPKVRDIGMRRLMGFVTTTAVAAPAAQSLGMYLGGVAQEQMDALQRRVAPWSRNSTLIPTSVKKGKDGKNYVTGYVDYSYLNPYDYWQRPARAILNAVNRGEIDKLDADKVILEAGYGILKELTKPFGIPLPGAYPEESIFAERLIDVTIRGGETRTGAKVYNDGSGEFGVDTKGDILLKSFAHIFDAFNPGAVEQVVGGIGPKPELGGKIGYNPSRLMTALTAPDGRDARGNVRQFEEEIAAFITGIREQKIDAGKVVKYGAAQYGTATRGASQIFNRAAKIESRMNPNNVIDAYAKANEVLYTLQNDMFRLVRDMRQLGMEDREIRKALNRYKVGNANRIMKGEFSPQNISDQIKTKAIKTQRELGGEFPIRAINAIRRSLLRRKLTGEPIEVERPEIVDELSSATVPEPRTLETAQAPTQPVAAATAPPVAAQAGAASAPLAVPATNPLANANPITLPDPRDQMLAQRLRGVG